ncbi:MAG: hypothetical protein GY757_17420 [bacterium]|nr:hypothetical protein [bacterium]
MSKETMNEEKWVELFKAIGLDKATMDKWHDEFEARYPEDHQRFLEWLSIPAEEIGTIRKSCGK